ncbi:hypothetical protein [Escherichia coli]|uniref:hypothetical protein n=1 Tax=Escherichia coli TaxID=562 RepID=UPI003855A0D5
MQHKLLINGELVSGEGEKQPVYNPATGDVLLEIAEASADRSSQSADGVADGLYRHRRAHHQPYRAVH